VTDTAEMWWSDADVDVIARVLWEDAIWTGELQDLGPQSWERNKPEYRRKALLVTQALSGRMP
jgi:hypothetical protein